MSTGFTVALLISLASSAAGTAQSPTFREINITSDSAAGWLPSEQLERDARGAADRYFAAMDNGRFREAYGMMHDANKTKVPYKEFEEESVKFRTQAGPLQRRELLKITWTKDPANAPYPGIYAAIDEAAVYQGVDRQCGYVILYQRREGDSFEVMRTENNFMDNASAANIAKNKSSAEVDRLWTALSANCPNFALLR